MTTLAQLAAEVSVTGADQATREVLGFGKSIDDTAAKSQKSQGFLATHEKHISTLGTASLVAGGAMVAGFGYMIGVTANFDKAMSGVGAVSNATEEDLDRLRTAALDAGQATAFSASEAATAEGELVKAGVSVNDVLGGALSGTLSLAAAGQLDLASAAVIAAQAMNLFDLEGRDVGHVADLLAAGANKSAADVSDLGDALRQGGLVAKQTGLSLEETVGALSLFADNALIGSDAGTSLKSMLQRLTPQSGEAAQLMEQLGISAYDASGQFVGLAEFSQNLRSSLQDLTPEQRNAALATIFGSDAVRAANVLYEAGGKKVREYVTAVNDQGAASRMAGAQMDNLAGDLEELRGSIETALIEGGSSATWVLRGLAQGATDAVNGFSDLPGPVQAVASGLVGVSGGGLLVVGMLGVMVPKVAAGVEAIKALAMSSSMLTTGLGVFGLALAAGTVALALWGGGSDGAANAADDFAQAVRDDTGALRGNTLEVIRNRLEQNHQLDDLRRMGVGFDTWSKAIYGNEQAQRRVRQALIESGEVTIRNSVDTKDATRATREHWIETGKLYEWDQRAGVQFKGNTGLLNELKDASAGVASEKRTLAQSTQLGAEAAVEEAQATSDLALSLGDAGVAAEQAAAKADELRDSLDLLFGASLGAEEANLRWRGSIADLTAGLVENGATLDLNTEKGRQNREQIVGATKDALDYAEALVRETGDTAAANVVLSGHIDQLAGVMRQAGFSEQQILEYSASVFGIPPEAMSNIHNTADLAKYLVDQYSGSLDGVDGRTVTTDVIANIRAIVTDSLRGILPWTADGGIFTTPQIRGFAEAGAEAVLPLTDPTRSWEIIAQSGLIDAMPRTLPASAGDGSRGLVTVQIDQKLSVSTNGMSESAVRRIVAQENDRLVDKVAAIARSI